MIEKRAKDIMREHKFLALAKSQQGARAMNMNREDAEKLANDLLSHYGKQSWDEHFKVKATGWISANHILVKDAQQFIAMLQRRGYTGILEEQDENGWLCWLNSEYTGRSYVRESFFLYETIATVAERLDKWYGAGAHHVCCIQCKEPLLLSVKYVDEQMQCEKWRGYRSAKAGPYTELLEACPGCGVALDGNTEEIRDDPPTA